MASEEDNLRVFTPPPSVHGKDGAEPTYGWSGNPAAPVEPTYGVRAGSINSGYVPSDNELVYGYAKTKNGRPHRV